VYYQRSWTSVDSYDPRIAGVTQTGELFLGGKLRPSRSDRVDQYELSMAQFFSSLQFLSASLSPFYVDSLLCLVADGTSRTAYQIPHDNGNTVFAQPFQVTNKTNWKTIIETPTGGFIGIDTDGKLWVSEYQSQQSSMRGCYKAGYTSLSLTCSFDSSKSFSLGYTRCPGWYPWCDQRSQIVGFSGWISGGTISSEKVFSPHLAGGYYITPALTATVSAPDQTWGRTATVSVSAYTPVLENSSERLSVLRVLVTDPGNGYSSPPTITVTDQDGNSSTSVLSPTVTQLELKAIAIDRTSDYSYQNWLGIDNNGKLWFYGTWYKSVRVVDDVTGERYIITTSDPIENVGPNRFLAIVNEVPFSPYTLPYSNAQYLQDNSLVPFLYMGEELSGVSFKDVSVSGDSSTPDHGPTAFMLDSDGGLWAMTNNVRFSTSKGDRMLCGKISSRKWKSFGGQNFLKIYAIDENDDLYAVDLTSRQYNFTAIDHNAQSETLLGQPIAVETKLSGSKWTLVGGTNPTVAIRDDMATAAAGIY
jgi:hypothetical protein